jgi:hypothetical protein
MLPESSMTYIRLGSTASEGEVASGTSERSASSARAAPAIAITNPRAIIVVRMILRLKNAFIVDSLK